MKTLTKALLIAGGAYAIHRGYKEESQRPKPQLGSILTIANTFNTAAGALNTGLSVYDNIRSRFGSGNGGNNVSVPQVRLPQSFSNPPPPPPPPPAIHYVQQAPPSASAPSSNAKAGMSMTAKALIGVGAAATIGAGIYFAKKKK